MKMKIVDRYEKQNTKIYYSTEPKSFFHRELCPYRDLKLRLRNMYVGSTSCQECEHFENINRFQKFINCEF